MWGTDFKDSAATSLPWPRHFQGSVLVGTMECIPQVIQDMWRCIWLFAFEGSQFVCVCQPGIF